MARASTLTMLPLDRWAEIIGIHPLHFNQIELPDLTSHVCGMPILQYSWQHADRVGREEIAQAIAMAETNICHELGFKLLPQWEQEEVIFPRAQYSPVRLSWKYVLRGGKRAKTLIDDGAAVTYSDGAPVDTYSEIATISVATTVTDPDEIRIYYPGKSGEDEYEIRPITVTIASGTATITCKRHQLVILGVQEELLDPRAVDGNTNSNFLTTVDVYRVYNDPSVMADIMVFNGGCCGTGCESCQYASYGGCLTVANSRNGIVHLNAATWNADDSVYNYAVLCGVPAKATLYYQAGRGHNGSHVKLTPEWERAIAYYALSFLDRPLCKCNTVNAVTGQWTTDLAQRVGGPGGSVSFAIPNSVKDCPLGTTKGAINAWRLIQKEMVGEAG